MTAVAASAAERLESPARSPRQPVTGLPVLLRFTLRLNRVRLLVWFAVIVGLFAYVAVYYKSQFTTQAALDDFARLGAGAGMKALVGGITATNTLGGAVWLKIWMTLALALGIGVVFLVTRNLRADEDAGRLDLLRSTPLGINADLAAVACLTAGLSVLCGAGVTAASLALGLDANRGLAGSAVFGASLTLIGLVGMGVGVLTNQVAASGRTANGLGSAAFGVFYALRAIGDLQENGLTWISPIGWAEKMDPWGANRWWLTLPSLALVAALIAAAWALQSRRDVGEGLLQTRPGPARAARWMTGEFGLGLRLQRGVLIAWGITLALAALLFGSLVNAMTSVMNNVAGGLIRGTGTDALLALLVALLALLCTVVGVQVATSLRADEAGGTLEAQLARPVSRWRWALSRLALAVIAVALSLVVAGGAFGASYGASIGDASQTWRLAGAALVYLPACLLIASVAVLGLGWWPRASTAVAWGVFAAMWFALLLGEALHLPAWVSRALPFTGTPLVPQAPVTWTPLVAYSAAMVLLAAAGLWRFSRRDVPR
jgi:ABC-2 type transport system permease protein